MGGSINVRCGLLRQLAAFGGGDVEAGGTLAERFTRAIHGRVVWMLVFVHAHGKSFRWHYASFEICNEKMPWFSTVSDMETTTCTQVYLRWTLRSTGCVG